MTSVIIQQRLLRIIAVKVSATPSGISIAVKANGQTGFPCSLTKRRYLRSVERLTIRPEGADRLMTTFM